MTGQVGLQEGPISPYVAKLASALSDFNNSLASGRSGSLAQIWLPEAGEDGGIVLNTQGLPYSINGVGDLLALFRCISCKYKFSTDVSKPQQMGAVGRVFTSGEPEMSNHVQRYDQHVYLRAAEAQRCRVHSTLFMPLYASAARDSCLGVFEVVLTDPDVNFAGMVGWIISCLQSQGMFTAEVDTGSLGDQRLGLRQLGAHDDGVSALESGIAPRNGGGSAEDANGVAGSTMLLPLKREAVAGEAEAARQQPDGGAAGDAAKSNPALQRLASGPAGLPSPAPQQQQMAPGSGSGGATGPLPPTPAALPGLQQGIGLQQGGSHRMSGSLEGLPALMGSGGSLPNGVAGLHSGHHSGSGGLPSASTAQQQQQLAAAPGGADPQAVAAMVSQLLQQHSGIAGGLAGAPQQLAALLSAHTMQQPSPAGLSLGPSSVLNGGPGASPGVTGLAAVAAAAQAQQQQALSLPQPPGPGGDAAAQQAQQAQQQQQQQQDDEMDEDTDEDDKPFLRPAPGAAQKYGQGNRILTYDDLAAQFGYGLKEAAARLNICPTTLKRACRRLGVPRWPRREIVKHKKRKQSVKGEGSQQPNGSGAQLNGAASLPNGAAKGFSSGSGPSSGGTAGGNLPLPLLAQAGSLPRPASSSLLNGLQGLDQLQLPMPAAAAAAPGGLPPELAAALASTLQQQQQQQQNPAIVSQVLTLLQQAQQQAQQQEQPGGGMLNGGQQTGVSGALPLPPLAPTPAGGAQLPPRSSPLPPAPLLSNLGLPRKADSKLNQSVGQGMGSLDILAAADFEMSVGNMSVGNSPRIALSNLGGLSNLGLSAFDFTTGAVAGGNGPAATATGGAGGATGPQNGPAVSSGAVSRPPADKS